MGGIKEVIFLVEESEEGGYEAKALGHSIYTQAENLENLKIAIKDALKCHFEEEERPQMITFSLSLTVERIAKNTGYEGKELEHC